MMSASHALHRLTSLQRLCERAQLEALLLIGGTDSRYHPASKHALGWLLNGLSGRDVFSSASGPLDLDEVVLLITPDGARMYCLPHTNDALAARLARWTRLQLWVPDTALLDDTEQLEHHKIISFIQMLQGLKRVGVPVSSSNGASQAADGPAATVEAWPLVQAFALQEFEEYTGGGFFVSHPTPQHAMV